MKSAADSSSQPGSSLPGVCVRMNGLICSPRLLWCPPSRRKRRSSRRSPQWPRCTKPPGLLCVCEPIPNSLCVARVSQLFFFHHLQIGTARWPQDNPTREAQTEPSPQGVRGPVLHADRKVTQIHFYFVFWHICNIWLTTMPLEGKKKSIHKRNCIIMVQQCNAHSL